VPIEDLEKATLNDELIIDKKLTLRHPLNDPRTKPQRRRFYLMQEQLMIDLAQIEREEVKEEEYDKLLHPDIIYEELNGVKVAYWNNSNDYKRLTPEYFACQSLKNFSDNKKMW